MMLDQNYFQAAVNQHYNLTLRIDQQHHLLIRAESTQQLIVYETSMTKEHILQHKIFGFFFQNTGDLFKFIAASCNDVKITQDGTILINMIMPVGKVNKQIQFKIPMTRQQVDFISSLNKRLAKMTRNVEEMREENQKLLVKCRQREQSVNMLKESVQNLQKVIGQKDQVINSIFTHLRQLTKWKQEKEKLFIEIIKFKRPFIADQTNAHNSKFTNIGNRFKKITGGSWDLLINQNEIQKNNNYRYYIKQVKAGNNGSFMYGIGTQVIKGINRAQDNKEFIGYYENTGNVYDRGESKKGGRKIKEGEVMTVQIDTKAWKISWLIQGIKQAEAMIIGEFRSKPFYLAVIIYNQDSEIQFL